MRHTTQKDLNNDQNYRSLSANHAYLYACYRLRKMNIWSLEECKDIAYDITIEAILELLVKQQSGDPVNHKKKFMIYFVNNYLRREDFKRFVERRIDSVDLEIAATTVSEDSHLTNVDNAKTLDGFSILEDLTDFEKALVQLKNEGYNWKDIAKKLNTSTATVSRKVGELRIKINRRLYLGD